MANVPKPRRAGQTGGGGRLGQAGNRSLSQSRGGRPHAGGGGGGKKGNGCAIVTFGSLGALVFAAYEGVRAVF